MCCEKNICEKDSGTTTMTGDGPHSPHVFRRRKSSTFAANVFMVTTAIPPAWLRDSQYRDSRAASTTANESSEGTESTVRGKAHSAASSIQSVNRPLSHAALQSQCKKPTADSSTRSLQPSQAGSVEVAIMVAQHCFPYSLQWLPGVPPLGRQRGPCLEPYAHPPFLPVECTLRGCAPEELLQTQINAVNVKAFLFSDSSHVMSSKTPLRHLAMHDSVE